MGASSSQTFDFAGSFVAGNATIHFTSGTASPSALKRARPAPGSTSSADGEIGIVQKSPELAMPGSKSWTCSAAPVKRSIQTKPNEPRRRRPSVPT